MNLKKYFSFVRKKFQTNVNLKKLKKFNKFKRIIVIGMGGSILGTAAVKNFLSEKIKKEIILIDNIDILKFLKLIK